MVRHKIKKAVAIAMSAVIALTAVPNLPLQYEKKADNVPQAHRCSQE